MIGGSGQKPAVADRPASRLLPMRRRLALTTLGLLIFSAGIVLNLQANVGQGPWQAFSFGATLHLPLTFGQANTLIGAGMVVVSWLLRVRPGIATAMNIGITGVGSDALLALAIIPKTSGGIDGYLMLMLGVVTCGLGIAVYVKGGLGAGPRDSFMLGLAAHLGGRIAPARTAMDLAAACAGWLLGAPIGPGTLIFALALGPAVGLWFRVLRVPVRKASVARLQGPGHVSRI